MEDAEWIINNIEEIGTALAKGVLKYFDIQFQKADSSLENDVNVLQKFGIITSPDYWRENAVQGKTVNGEYAATLIQRMAELLTNKYYF